MKSAGVFFSIAIGLPVFAQPVFNPDLTLQSPGGLDQDDMCVWLHPVDASRSVLITSDKEADSLYAYDLRGGLLQSLPCPYPGNIDIRYGFRIGQNSTDLVCVNNRRDSTIRIYSMDAGSRLLTRVDRDAIKTGLNYGLTMYNSRNSGAYYVFTSSQTGLIEQFLLSDSGGQVSGRKVRSVSVPSQVEGLVADDETGFLYAGEEKGGVWKFFAEPDSGVQGTKVISVDQNGLVADVEGLALYYAASGSGYLLVSSQGNSTYHAYDRRDYRWLGSFSLNGVGSTDGIEICSKNLGSDFPQGVFLSHNGLAAPYPVMATSWAKIADSLNLSIDTAYFKPRGSPTPVLRSRYVGDSGRRRKNSISLLGRRLSPPYPIHSLNRKSTGFEAGRE